MGEEGKEPCKSYVELVDRLHRELHEAERLLGEAAGDIRLLQLALLTCRSEAEQAIMGAWRGKIVAIVDAALRTTNAERLEEGNKDG